MNQTMIEFRAPKLGDEEAIATCMRASADIADMTDGTPEGLGEWLKICSPGEIRSRITSGERSMVAIADDEIVGYIAFRRSNHLSLLFVRKNWAGNGIGRKLFDKCSSGLPSITVNSSDLAVGFYEKLGFAATGERHLKAGAMVTPMTWVDRSVQQTR